MRNKETKKRKKGLLGDSVIVLEIFIFNLYLGRLSPLTNICQGVENTNQFNIVCS